MHEQQDRIDNSYNLEIYGSVLVVCTEHKLYTIRGWVTEGSGVAQLREVHAPSPPFNLCFPTHSLVARLAIPFMRARDATLFQVTSAAFRQTELLSPHKRGHFPAFHFLYFETIMCDTT
jgi:hypothetical protein